MRVLRVVLIVLIESQVVSEGIEQRHHFGVPGNVLDTGPEILVTFRGQLLMKLLQSDHVEKQRCPRSTVAVVLAQVQNRIAP